MLANRFIQKLQIWSQLSWHCGVTENGSIAIVFREVYNFFRTITQYFCNGLGYQKKRKVDNFGECVSVVFFVNLAKVFTRENKG